MIIERTDYGAHIRGKLLTLAEFERRYQRLRFQCNDVVVFLDPEPLNVEVDGILYRQLRSYAVIPTKIHSATPQQIQDLIDALSMTGKWLTDHPIPKLIEGSTDV